MKIRFARRRAPFKTLACAAALAASCLAAPAARADIGDQNYVLNGDWGYKINNMPDIDQRRDSLGFVFGLPNKGSEYCVPTSSMNLLGYVASHGYPGVVPGDNDWTATNKGQYNEMSLLLLFLGGMMGTDPMKGTSGDGIPNAMKVFLDPSLFAVDHIYASKTFCPVIKELGMMAIQGRLVDPVIGWYTYPDTPLPHGRSGGHQVTMSEVYSGSQFLSGLTQIGIRDPANDSVNLFAQSAYATDLYSTEDVQGFFGDLSTVWPRTQTRIIGYGSAYIDGALVVKPKMALASKGLDLELVSPVVLFNRENHKDAKSYRGHGGSAVRDLALDPIGVTSPYLLEGQDGIYEINHVTGESTVLGGLRTETGRLLPTNPLQIQMGGPERRLYVLQTNTIGCWSRDGRPITSFTLRKPLVAIAFDQKENRLFGFGADGAVSQYSPDLELLRTDMVPALAVRPAGATVRVADDPITGNLWFLVEGSSTVQNITFTQSFGLLIPAVRPVELRGAHSPKGIDMDDFGALFVTDHGKIAVFDQTGKRMERNPFEGFAADGPLHIIRSFTNYNPEEHSGPSYYNVLPEDAGPR